jgi:hypothetical protein
MTMLAHIPRVEHVTYACAIEQRDIIVAMSAHPGHYVIPVEVAQTIASWYHSPADGCRNITALSHGMPFDTVALMEEIRLEIQPIDAKDAAALLHWVDAEEARLTHADYLRRG